MSLYVMLAGILKTRRLEKNLSTLDLSVRTRLDPSLISRYENGNRLPTRDHVLRLAQALDMDQQLVLVAWLSEKLKKVLLEENLEEVRKKAMDVLLEKTRPEELFLAAGSQVTASQETALKKWKADFQRLAKLFPERLKRYEEQGRISLTRDINHLNGNSWSVDHANAFLLEGKTFPDHDFESHVQLHRTYALLPKQDQLTDTLLLNQINEFGKTDLDHLSFSVSPYTLASIAQAWQKSLSLSGMQDAQRWLALVLLMKNNDFPLASLPVQAPPANPEEPVLHLAEYFGEWLVKEMRRAIDFLEE
ncbi:MAG: helix-turn-helix domain-containing protein [Bacteroidia bacterium]